MDWNYFADLVTAMYADDPAIPPIAERIRSHGLDVPGQELWNEAGPCAAWITVRLRGPLPRVDDMDVALIRYPHWALVMISDDRPDEELAIPELRERALYDAARPFFDALPGRETVTRG